MKRFNTYRNKYRRIFVILGWGCLNTVQKHKSGMKKVVLFIFFVIKNLHSLNDTILKVSKGKYFQHILSGKDLYPNS